ncbi:MAG: NADH-quinone oxidoreductase subunit A [Thermodesulfobacteriota bacterium]
MLFEYANVFIFIVLGLLMTLIIITVSKILAPSVHDVPDKFTTYECGERPVGSARVLFNFRFYTVALAFLIFEIELVLVFPCVTVFRKWLGNGLGWLALLEIVIFVGILFLGLIYMWRHGDIKWIKDVAKELDEEVPLN